MQLDRSNPFAAIGWVRPELDGMIQRLQRILEDVSENEAGPGDAREFAETMDQMELTLSMLGATGVVALAQEMKKAWPTVLGVKTEGREQALSIMMQALVVLGSYLDRLESGNADMQAILLPVLDQLSTVRKALPRSAGDWFDIDLDQAPSSPVDDATSVPDQDHHSERMRANHNAWREALAGCRSENWSGEAIDQLITAANSLSRELPQTDWRRLFWVAATVLDGIRSGQVDNNITLQSMMSRLDGFIMDIPVRERSQLWQESRQLSSSLLFYIAIARPGNPGLDEVVRLYKLHELVPEREALERATGGIRGRNKELFASLRSAINEELETIKDQLDLAMRTGNAEQDPALDQRLAQLGDTLSMVGMNSLGDSLLANADEWRSNSNESGVPPEQVMSGLAERLLRLETSLDSHVDRLGMDQPLDDELGERVNDDDSGQEVRSMVRHLLEECLAEARETRDLLRGWINDALDERTLEQVAQTFDKIQGAMTLIGQPGAAAEVDRLGHVSAPLLAKAAPDNAALVDAFADAYTAMELLLTHWRDEQPGAAKILQTLQRSNYMLENPDDVAKVIPLERESKPATEAAVDDPSNMQQPADAEDSAATPSVDLTPASGETADTTEAEQATEPEAEPVTEEVQETTAAPEQDEAMDPEMAEIFLEEFGEVQQTLQEQVPLWQAKPSDLARLNEVRRAFHTLKGGGRMIGASEIGEFSWQVEHLLNQVMESGRETDRGLANLIGLSLALLPSLGDRLRGETGEYDTDLVARVGAALDEQSAGTDKGALGALRQKLPDALAELIDAVEPEPASAPDATTEDQADATEQAADEQAEQDQAETSEAPAPAPESAEEMGAMVAVEVSQHLSVLTDFHAAMEDNPAVSVTSDAVRAAHTVAGNLALVRLGNEPDIMGDLEDLFDARLGLGSHWPDGMAALLGDILVMLRTRLEQLENPAPEGSKVSLDTGDLQQRLAKLRAGVEQDTEADGGDGEILALFLEEASEVLERSDTLIAKWRQKQDKLELVAALQREIHTLKGGARMAGRDRMGDLAHEMETTLERISEGKLPASKAAIGLLENGCDALLGCVEALLHGTDAPSDEQLQELAAGLNSLDQVQAKEEATEQAEVEDLTEAVDEEETAEVETAEAEAEAEEPVAEDKQEQTAELEEDAQAEVETQAKPELATPLIEIPVQPPEEKTMRPMPEVAEATDSGQDTVRVSADLMENLVNFAGEISIYRARLSQQNIQFRFNLGEMADTVDRLREQLRKMEIETEAQILSRFQREADQGAPHFDPLELDRFSTLQQLSRALSESVADLMNLEEMLADGVRQSETLLLQQSRVNTELQEGMMQTRMVPFASLGPRLRRVVRQAASETKRQASLDLQLAGASDGQLDRSVLERMTAPLEHMLRNALAHGIETPAQRKKAGKPEEGKITITVENEATELVIRVEDDGQGIDLAAVRKQAIERKLMTKKQKVSDEEVLDFIMSSGFSTARKVTQLAGRGIGMDVVASQVRQIGGSMDIDTKRGRGTCFTIRIPFTLAVMQAIHVLAGDREFAMPLASVAGVGKLQPAEYRERMSGDAPTFQFAGETYSMLELSPLLGFSPRPLDEEPVTLLMIRAGDQRAALRVDELQGHREIVIKPVGPQISAIPGVLGGTITGDGDVTIILDPGPLIRKGVRQRSTADALQPPIEAAPRTTPLIMVVDDSITMRKVNSRVLENNHMEVITAKDGVDAVEQLHDVSPDLVLLDIEMPRMDGFELAEHLRNDARFRDLPLIMITSRTGKKHRDRAHDLGVNRYLTKPYQEAELLRNVRELLDLEED